MDERIFSLKLDTKEDIAVILNNWAEQAHGNVLMRVGETTVLVTAVMGKNESPNQTFFPLTVDYEERFYAAGKILGSRFVRREGKPSDEAVITARLIDRAIRPLFPKDFTRETQVITTCLSWDGQNDPDIAGLLGASLALSLSPIPWNGPLGVVRIGRIDGKFILNPTYEERAKSDLDFVVAGVKDGETIRVNMIEAEANEIPEDVFETALQFAQPLLLKEIAFQEELIKEFGREKISYQEFEPNENIEKEIKNFLGNKLEEALFQGEKQQRIAAVEQLKIDTIAHMEQELQGMANASYVLNFFERAIDELVHRQAIEKGRRVDDRKLDEIRQLDARVAMLPRTHGSALFIRGQTKTLSILTLGSPGEQKVIEGMELIGKKRFMHHYNFPPYAPGEVKPLRGPGRREIGHGMLAEKALEPVIPNFEEFPYTIRIVTEVVSSNGSTSMASACSSSLALMDAGVPIKNPVAGISIGLMSGEKEKYALLTDIQGPEDHYGDMDFKVAGTKQGITAIQLDVKIRGISAPIFQETLQRAKNARTKILDEVITKILPAPRAEISPFAPKIFVLQINPEKIGLVIGTGGKTINKIIEEYDVEIDIEPTGEVYVSSDSKERGQQAVALIKNMTKEIQVGELYEGTVKRIMDFGAFVEILPGHEGLVHISQLAPYHVNKVTDIVKVGDVIPVKVIEIDNQGRINLSLKEATQKQNT
ncbi:MAG: polyribonucleotide nucleotidyltransferase [Candidatus Wildermuthbacteria bacterium]|nr:polyribonucleotide nucleotidyltransferase [Candidatus Wildermuthbacteria bacterium]